MCIRDRVLQRARACGRHRQTHRHTDTQTHRHTHLACKREEAKLPSLLPFLLPRAGRALVACRLLSPPAREALGGRR
eukprot:3936629-Rhodomonas_salina.1